MTKTYESRAEYDETCGEKARKTGNLIILTFLGIATIGFGCFFLHTPKSSKPTRQLGLLSTDPNAEDKAYEFSAHVVYGYEQGYKTCLLDVLTVAINSKGDSVVIMEFLKEKAEEVK